MALDVAEVAAETLERLRRRVAAFDDEATPYPSRQSPMFQRHYGDYDHLARVKEWNPGWEDTR